MPGSAPVTTTGDALDFPSPRVASPTPTARSTVKPTASAESYTAPAPAASTASRDSDEWFAPAAWLLIILTGIGATCYVVWRRRERRFVGGPANDDTIQ
ncbi:AtpZ/AtpI family protein [[Actinomadura] parvosata]|uniref:AtpZ/AtpI family protein n=1 Tax=[Actinomadura] parvosata TaxID=1955412 RepID=UPI00406C9BCA